MTFNEMYTAYATQLGDAALPRSKFRNKAELEAAMPPPTPVGRITRSLTKVERSRLRRAAKSNPTIHPHGARWSSHDVPSDMLKLVGT